MQNNNYLKSKNILYVEGNTDGTIGGSYFSLLYLVNSLNRCKYNPFVIFYHEHSLVNRFDATKIIILPVAIPFAFSKAPYLSSVIGSKIRTIFQKIINFFKFIDTIFKYIKIIKQNKIKLVHLNNSITKNHEWIVAAKISGINCISHQRGINQKYSRLSRYLGKHIDAIISISNAVKKNLTNNNISKENIVTIYNGIDPYVINIDIQISRLLKLHNIEDNSLCIGIVGNIKEWKGQETLIRSMPLILKKFPKVKCLLIGDTSTADQYYFQNLQIIIDKLQISSSIIFTGFTRDVPSYINLLKVVIHTSIQPEPFGRVLIEAMALKKPIIATEGGAVSEIVVDGKTGIIVQPGNSKMLAEAVNSYLSDPEKAKTFGSAGYRRLQEKFMLQENIRRTEELYNKLLFKPSG